MKQIENEKENEINFEANNSIKEDDIHQAKFNYALVIHGSIKEIEQLDQFLKYNHFKIRFQKVSPKFLKIVEGD